MGAGMSIFDLAQKCSTAHLRSWAHVLGGEVSGNGLICPGPGHSTRDRSLSVTLSSTSPDGFIVYSHAGDDWRACRDYVRARLGLPEFRQGRPQKSPLGGQSEPVGYMARTELKKAASEFPSDGSYNHKPAMAIWAEAHDPRGTLVEQYLKSRALEPPGKAANESIRFHSDCPFGNERWPAMICLVRSIVTNEPQGIHRTALATEGSSIKRNGKTFRLSLGPVSGGVIKIDPDEDVTMGLCIGEGLESCLAGRQMGLWPVWCAISTGGVASFPVLQASMDCIFSGITTRTLQGRRPLKNGFRDGRTRAAK
jgi:putative DNA primase/helicase